MRTIEDMHRDIYIHITMIAILTVIMVARVYQIGEMLRKKKVKPVKKYVVGFAFDFSFENLLVITKNRPAFMAGKKNGPGGSVEANETPLMAMIREFKEETGIDTSASDWKMYLIHRGPWAGDNNGTHNFEIYFFVASIGLARLSDGRTMETEVVSIDHVATLDYDKTVPNLRWHLPMGISFFKGEHAEHFELTEIHNG